GRAPDRREGRPAESLPPPVHALGRRAGLPRPARLQRRRAKAYRRSRRTHQATRDAMRIAVCAPQVPFVRGGAELMAEDLVAALRERGHEAELVTVPFKWYPGTRVLDQAFLWRLVDLTESDRRSSDLVLAAELPSYPPPHPNKRVWVLHQSSQAYELDRTDLGQFSEEPSDRALRRSVQNLDSLQPLPRTRDPPA